MGNKSDKKILQIQVCIQFTVYTAEFGEFSAAPQKHVMSNKIDENSQKSQTFLQSQLGIHFTVYTDFTAAFREISAAPQRHVMSNKNDKKISKVSSVLNLLYTQTV